MGLAANWPEPIMTESNGFGAASVSAWRTRKGKEELKEILATDGASENQDTMGTITRNHGESKLFFPSLLNLLEDGREMTSRDGPPGWVLAPKRYRKLAALKLGP